MRLLKFFSDKEEILSRSFVIAIINIVLGFSSLSVPGFDDFFGNHIWVFYISFFGPLCLIVIAYALGFLSSIKDMYDGLRDSGKTVWKSILIIVIGLIVLLMFIIINIWLNII